MSQCVPKEVESGQTELAQSTMTMVQMNSILRNMFVNIDETVVYFDTDYNYTVSKRGAKTVSVQHGNSNKKQCTVCITVAADGIKPTLFVIFKGAVNRRIANSLHQIIPDGIYACTKPKGWMDDRVMQLWKEKIWKPYIEGMMRSALILDRMEFHIHPGFIDTVDELGTRVITIPGGFTSVSAL